MTVKEVNDSLGKLVKVKTRNLDGEYLFTAYIFRIEENKKIYQAEVRNTKPPHEIYIVSLKDIRS